VWLESVKKDYFIVGMEDVLLINLNVLLDQHALQILQLNAQMEAVKNLKKNVKKISNVHIILHINVLQENVDPQLMNAQH